ncbi:AraC family transcriptional regulator [Ruegeria conchae]|uniref:AraC family transcriptional regulator n=1 Tax=Ruegeria conchae TaxID=981384 RepID=UPI0029C67AD0|nr:AraC family transcriptional regulator ligand-binding domain-containing protein [Ruegeria conchae]
MTNTPSMTIAEAMGSIPRTVADLLGQGTLDRCFAEAGLPVDLCDLAGSYIPEVAIDRFFQSTARRAGDEFFGATLARSVSVQDYGVWGDYVLQAPTLASALERATSIIHLHADKDTLTLLRRSNSVRFEYTFGERTGEGYRQIAMAAIGPLISIPRHYLGEAWLPRRIRIDNSERGAAKRLEGEFNCDVLTNGTAISIEISNADLRSANLSKISQVVTREDVERACCGGPPVGILSIVEELILQRIGVRRTSIADIAEATDLSKRTLQRLLHQEGISFRSLSNIIRMRRAQELLVGSSLSVSEIATLLDYATPSHFARAFQKSFAVAPLVYRGINSPQT